jgi:hypothetical protein
LNTEEILATDSCIGSKHDFELFKQTRCGISQQTCALGDSGYQGLAKLHLNSQTPAKKSKLHPLSQEQKTSTTWNSKPNSNLLLQEVYYIQDFCLTVKTCKTNCQ